MRFLIEPRRVVERALRRWNGHKKLLDLTIAGSAVVGPGASGGQSKATGKYGGDPAIDEDTVFVAVQLLDQIAYRESLLRLIYRGEITGWINEDGEPAFRATA